MEKKIHEITLTGYSAEYKDGILQLGTKESYGIEQLHVTLAEGWEDLTVTAVFTNGGSTEVIMNPDGMIIVPPEATAMSTSAIRCFGRIVFRGAKDGVQRVSTDLLYIVTDHAPADGDNTIVPTPDQYAQFIAEVGDAVAKAEAAADRAVGAGYTVDPELVKQFVTDYLDVNPVQSTPLDITLSKENEAAEAKAVGEALQQHEDSVQQQIFEIESTIEALDTAKQPAGDYLTVENDPTVPAWAKAASKPAYTYSEVGAAPADHLADQNNPHGVTVEQIGAAPVGYGLGENAKIISDPNTATENGWYGLNGTDSGNTPAEWANMKNGSLFVERRYDLIYQTIKHNVYEAKRWCYSNSENNTIREWQPWEWVNPPMSTNVEYRTTERWNDKVVYAKLLDCGELPNATYKEIPIGAAITDLVSLDVIATESNSSSKWRYHLPAIWGNGTVYCYACVVGSTVRIDANNYDMSAYTGKALVKYTKE